MDNLCPRCGAYWECGCWEDLEAFAEYLKAEEKYVQEVVIPDVQNTISERARARVKPEALERVSREITEQHYSRLAGQRLRDEHDRAMGLDTT